MTRQGSLSPAVLLSLALFAVPALPANAQTSDPLVTQIEAALAANSTNPVLQSCLNSEPAIEQYRAAANDLANVGNPKYAPPFNCSGIGASWQEVAPPACCSVFERDRLRNTDAAWTALQQCGLRDRIEKRRPAYAEAAEKCLNGAGIASSGPTPAAPLSGQDIADIYSAWAAVMAIQEPNISEDERTIRMFQAYWPLLKLSLKQQPGQDVFFVRPVGREPTTLNNRGVEGPLPGFLSDRIRQGFTVFDDRAWLQAALASFNTAMGVDELLSRLRADSVDPALQFAWFGDTFVRYFIPNSSFWTSVGPQLASSEHATIRGSINGGGDFVYIPPDEMWRVAQLSPRLPYLRPVVWSPAAARQVESEVRLELPTAVVTAEGGPARVVVDLAPHGAAAVLVVSGRVRVRETRTNDAERPGPGEAVLVWPGAGVSRPAPVSAERFDAAARPRIRGSIVLRPGERWSGSLRLDPTLPIETRLPWDKPAGGAYALEIWINGRPLVDPVLNKMSPMRYADGRNYPYREPNSARWMLFYSADYTANNGPAGGAYEVRTDEGQAYRYVWDITPLRGNDATAQVEFRNAGDPGGPSLELRLLPAEATYGGNARLTPVTPPPAVTNTPPASASAAGGEEKKASGGWFKGLLDALTEGAGTTQSPAPAAGARVGAPVAGNALLETQEREPNNDAETAMPVEPGTTVDGALTAGAIRGRATDIDFYRVPVASPGLYTVTVALAAPECAYSVGLPNLRRARGPSTMTVDLTGEQRTEYTLQFGGQPEERSGTFGPEPRELVIAIDTEAWSSSSDRGVQCVKDGAWYREIPYSLSITAGGPAAASGTPSTARPVVQEQEPNNDSAEAMPVQPGTTVNGTLTAGAIRGRATDIDFYHVPVASPGRYTITATLAVAECDYSVGLPSLRRASGTSTMTVDLTGQQRTNYTLRFGGQPEEQSGTLGPEPRELLIAIDTEAWSSSSDRGVQCVRDGAWYQEIPYRLTIEASRPAGTAPPSNAGPVPAAAAGATGTRAETGVFRSPDFGEPAAPAGRISNIVTARDVQGGTAVGITDTFTPDVNPIHVWFHVTGFAPGTIFTTRWTYLGGTAPLIIGTGETPALGPISNYGTFSYELAPGKRWPAGDYRVEILLGGTVLGTAVFTVVRGG